jgi:hypothetical protein
MLEMKLVLRSVLARNHLRVGGAGLEVSRRRSITLSPSGGATTILDERARLREPESVESLTGVPGNA